MLSNSTWNEIYECYVGNDTFKTGFSFNKYHIIGFKHFYSNLKKFVPLDKWDIVDSLLFDVINAQLNIISIWM